MKSRRALLCSGIVLSLSVPLMAGCGKDATPVTTTVAPSLSGTLSADPTLTLVAQLLKDSGREATLAEGGPYTLFVPTNEALEAHAKSIGFESAAALVATAASGTGAAAEVLDDIIVEGTVRAGDFADNAGETFQTLGGTDVTISVENGAVALTTASAKATVTSLEVTSGDVTIHVVDAVIS